MPFLLKHPWNSLQVKVSKQISNILFLSPISTKVAETTYLEEANCKTQLVINALKFAHKCNRLCSHKNNLKYAGMAKVLLWYY